MSKKNFHFFQLIRQIFVALLLVFFAGCRQTKRLVEGDYLLNKNRIVTDIKNVDYDALEGILKQKPNRKIIVGRFHLWVYNIPNPSKMQRRIDNKESRVERKNIKRKAKGKKPKIVGRTTDEWLREVVGEAPVIVEPTMFEQIQLKLRS